MEKTLEDLWLITRCYISYREIMANALIGYWDVGNYGECCDWLLEKWDTWEELWLISKCYIEKLWRMLWLDADIRELWRMLSLVIGEIV